MSDEKRYYKECEDIDELAAYIRQDINSVADSTYEEVKLLVREVKAYRKVRGNVLDSIAVGLIQGNARKCVLDVIKYIDEVTENGGDND